MQKLIKKYKLSYTLEDVSSPEWSKGNHFHYIINVDDQEFDYWTSVADYTKGKDYLTDMDLLLAFRAVAEDALYSVQYELDEFLVNLGYDEDLESVRSGEKAYSSCEESFSKLGYSEAELIDILDELDKYDIC